MRRKVSSETRPRGLRSPSGSGETANLYKIIHRFLYILSIRFRQARMALAQSHFDSKLV